MKANIIKLFINCFWELPDYFFLTDFLVGGASPVMFTLTIRVGLRNFKRQEGGEKCVKWRSKLKCVEHMCFLNACFIMFPTSMIIMIHPRWKHTVTYGIPLSISWYIIYESISYVYIHLHPCSSYLPLHIVCWYWVRPFFWDTLPSTFPAKLLAIHPSLSDETVKGPAVATVESTTFTCSI